jgi:hypothetical protein
MSYGEEILMDSRKRFKCMNPLKTLSKRGEKAIAGREIRRLSASSGGVI